MSESHMNRMNITLIYNKFALYKKIKGKLLFEDAHLINNTMMKNKAVIAKVILDSIYF